MAGFVANAVNCKAVIENHERRIAYFLRAANVRAGLDAIYSSVVGIVAALIPARNVMFLRTVIFLAQFLMVKFLSFFTNEEVLGCVVVLYGNLSILSLRYTTRVLIIGDWTGRISHVS